MKRNKDDDGCTEEFPYRTMDEVVHRCLKCNSVAFEVMPESFVCSFCGFEWETL